MKINLFICFFVLGFQSIAQVADFIPNQFFPGKSYHTYFDSKTIQILDASNKPIFDLNYDTFEATDLPDYFKATKGDSCYILNPETKLSFSYPHDLKKYYPFSRVNITQSFFSKTVLLVLGEWTYLKLDGSLIFDGNSYSESGSDLSKKYTFKTELDFLLDDPDFWSIPDTELDEYSIKHKYLLTVTDKWFSRHPFDEYVSGFEPIDYYYSETMYLERYHVVKVNKKMGLMSTVGKYILEPVYDNIEIREAEQNLSTEKYLTIFGRMKNKTFVFDQAGNKLGEFEGISISEYPNPYNLGYDYYLDGFEIKKGKKSGIINDQGQLIVPPLYDVIDYFGLRDSNLLRVPKNKTDLSSCTKYPFDYYLEGMNHKTRMHTFYDPTGRELNSFTLDYVVDKQRNGFFSFEFQSKIGLAGPGACIVKTPDYYNIELFKGNRDLFIADTEEESHFIDGTGKELYGLKNASAYFMDSNYAWVSINGKVGLMDVEASGESIIWLFEPENDKIEPAKEYVDVNETFIVCKNGKCGIFDIKKEVVLEQKFDDMKTIGNQLLVVENGKYGLYNSFYYPYFPEFYDSLMKLTYDIWMAKKNGKWAIIDVVKNSIKTPFELDAVHIPNYPINYRIVQKDGLWGVLDADYKWFIKPAYKSIVFLHDSNEFQCLNAKDQNECIQTK